MNTEQKVYRFNDLIEILTEHSQRIPDNPFIVFEDKGMSFKQLDLLSSQVAGFFYEQGLSHGDKVCLWMYNCPEFIVSYFAALKIGAVVVPIDNSFKEEEAGYIISHSEAKLLLCNSGIIKSGISLRNKIGSLKEIVSFSFDKDEYQDVFDFGDIVKTKHEYESESRQIHTNDVAEIIYTLGTTGSPKGVCITHRNLISNVEDIRKVIITKKNDKFICILPLSHSLALTLCMLLPFRLGLPVVVFRSMREIRNLWKRILKHKITLFVGIPPLFKVLMSSPLPLRLKYPFRKFFNPIRACFSGGIVLEPDIAREFEDKFGIPLIEGYGLTEASPVVTMNSLGRQRRIGSVGLSLSSVDVKVVDKNSKEVAVEETGELLVQGPNVMKGYLKNEQETNSMIKEGWLYTGDLARIDKCGYLYIVGRKSEIINVGGIKVSPREIEDVLCRHEKIEDSAVVGIKHVWKGEVPIGFIVFKLGEKVDKSRISKFLSRHLAAFKIPLRFIVKDELPKGASGKVLKRELKNEAEQKYG